MVDALTGWRYLFAAVLALSTDSGSIDQRLREAYRGSLRKIAPVPHLPPHLHEDFEKLMEELADLSGQDGQIDGRRAAALAKKIVVLYDRVTKSL